MSTVLFEEVCRYVRGVTAEIATEDLGRPTPCAEWDVSQVVLHLADVADGLVGLLDTGDLALPEPARTKSADPVAELAVALDALHQRLSDGADPERVEVATQAGSIDFTAHGWDVGSALRPGHRIPEPLAAEVLDLATTLLPDEGRAPRFADPVEVADDAPASDRLVAFLGRAPQSVEAIRRH